MKHKADPEELRIFQYFLKEREVPIRGAATNISKHFHGNENSANRYRIKIKKMWAVQKGIQGPLIKKNSMISLNENHPAIKKLFQEYPPNMIKDLAGETDLGEAAKHSKSNKETLKKGVMLAFDKQIRLVGEKAIYEKENFEKLLLSFLKGARTKLSFEEIEAIAERALDELNPYKKS